MSSKPSTNRYKIGAAERISGVPAVTIRMWERRYQALVPERTPSGGRLYTRDQIERLSRLRALVDAGHAISTVAHLSDAELESRLEAIQPERAKPSGPISVALIGNELQASWAELGDQVNGLDLIDVASDPMAALALDPARRGVDVLLIAIDALPPGATGVVQQLLEHFGARNAAVIYHFATRDDLARLAKLNIDAVKAPLRATQMARMIPAMVGREPADADEQTEVEALALRPPPPRRFKDAELAVLARQSSVVKCECPEHLAELVSKLSAFEAYSRQCQSANRSDAAIHMMLYGATAQVRRVMEDMLAFVVEHEAEQLDL